MNWWQAFAAADGRRFDPDPRGAYSVGALTDAATRAAISEVTARREVRRYRRADLVAEWAATTTALASTRFTPSVLSLVGLRAAIVDELERRGARAFSVWFAAEQRSLALGR